jgi:hypothetical protein
LTTYSLFKNDHFQKPSNTSQGSGIAWITTLILHATTEHKNRSAHIT